MATYDELYDLQANSALRNRVAVAAIKTVQGYIAGATPTSQQLRFSSRVLGTPEQVAVILLRYILAANSSSTAAQILAASDATIQTGVTAACDKLVTIEPDPA